MNERTLNQQALDHDCPTCGAKAGIRCRTVTHRPARPGYGKGSKVDVRPKQCSERATIAWREHLVEVRQPA